MKLLIDKEWFEKQAAAEGDLEIGAGGNRKTMTLNLTDDEIAQLQKLIDDHRDVIVPVPRGGIEPDWHAACILLRRRFRKLEKAAQFVVSEADRIHENERWPIKYRAPYEAITKLRKVLAEVGTPDPSPQTREVGSKPHCEHRQICPDVASGIACRGPCAKLREVE